MCPLSKSDALRERIEMALVEEVNRNALMAQEPEKFLPVFIQNATNKLLEIMQDEFTYRRF